MMMENKKYSMLVVGLYCDPRHIQRFCDNLKLINPFVDITILTDVPAEQQKMLQDKTIKIEQYQVRPVTCKIKRLRYFLIGRRQRKFFAKFCKGRNYDIVNVHFPYQYMSDVIGSLRKMSRYIIVSPWGSDVLRRDNLQLKRLSKLYETADYVTTFTYSNLGRKILKEFKIASQKLIGSAFGSDLIDFINHHKDSITEEEAKKRFGLEGRYVITCGYNMYESQRHLSIVGAIDSVKSCLPDNLTLLFPMTYGNKDALSGYVESVKEECKKRKLNAVFVTDYLEMEDLFKLRMATDMFVHVQSTDASSGSVKEYILCNKKIVHGSWIKYEELETYKPIFYFPVDRLENLGESILKAYKSDKIAMSQGLIDFVKSAGYESRMAKFNEFIMSKI